MKTNPAKKRNDSAERQYTQNAAGPARSARFLVLPVIHLPLARASNIADPGPDPEEQARQAETARILMDAISSLAPSERKLLGQALDSGLSLGEIARVTGIPKTTGHRRLKKILSKLRAYLSARGIRSMRDL